MNEKQLEFSLKSLESDAAMEALERRERGEPLGPDSPLSDKDVAAIKALAVDLDEQFFERKAAQLIGALRQPDVREIGSLDDARAARAARNAGVARDAGAARATRSRRLKQVAAGAVPLVLAAGFLLWLFPLGSLDVTLDSVAVTDSKLRSGAPAGPSSAAVPLTADSCVTVRISLHKTTGALSDAVSTQAYLVRGEQSVPWNLPLLPDAQGALSTTTACQPLPRGVTRGPWELVVLVGNRGQLRWHGQDALRATLGGGDHGEYSGIQYVRRSLQLAAEPAEPTK